MQPKLTRVWPKLGVQSVEADSEGLRSIVEEKCDCPLALNFMRLVVCGVDEPAFQRDGGRVLGEEVDRWEDMVCGP